jgi:tRNA(Ile)-lysidine synthetase-like protein
MKFELEPGRYLVAVSGGVDSCALLHCLAGNKQYELVVAHFDHGIRPDSADDRRFVSSLAEHYGLPFVSESAQLGPDANEAVARTARYDFLHRMVAEQAADAMITAHHQDDVLETAIINLLRGSGRKGLTALRDLPSIRRPLLMATRREVLAYADKHHLEWREDSSNADTRYLRNYIRHKLMPKFSESDKKLLSEKIQAQRSVNDEIDNLLETLPGWHPGDNSLGRGWFNTLPHVVAKEVFAMWLRTHGLREFDRQTLERLVVAGKVTQPDKQIDILYGVRLQVEKDRLALEGIER